jgi:cytochrome P450
MATYDPFSAACQADPYRVYRQMREEQPFYYSEAYGWWALFRYADIEAVSSTPEDFSSDQSLGGVSIDELGAGLGPGNFLDADEPEHRRMRDVLRKSFSPRDVAELRPMIERHVDELFDELIEGRDVDLARDFAWQVPVGVSSELLGFPRADGPLLRDLLQRFMIREPGKHELPAATVETTRELGEYFEAAVAESLSRPATGIVAEIAEAVQAQVITSEEARGMCILVFVASIATSVGLVGNGLQLFGKLPEQKALLYAEPERIPDAVEEILRYETPASVFRRHVTRPLDLLGTTLPKGAQVLLVYASANRDEARWPHAEDFDIGRERKRHLSFGNGVHHCLGAPVARLEGRIVLERLVSRVKDYELTGEAEWIPSHDDRALNHLPAVVHGA